MTTGIAFDQRPAPATSWATAALVVALSVAGLIHCFLMPAHFAESTLFGLGFLGAAVAQLGLAGLVIIRPRREVYLTIIAVSLTLIALYAFNVLVGLPFHAGESPAVGVEASVPAEAHDDAAETDAAAGEHDDAAGTDAAAEKHGDDEADHATGSGADDPAHEEGGHGEEGLVLGAGEPVDVAGASTQAAQLAAIALAALLVNRKRPLSAGSS